MARKKISQATVSDAHPVLLANRDVGNLFPNAGTHFVLA